MQSQNSKILSLKLLTLPLLALLLLLSPCSVKGAVQSALDLEVSRSLNKNKTTAPQLISCYVWNDQSQLETVIATKKTLDKKDFRAFSQQFLATHTTRKPSYWVEQHIKRYSELPLYILYKRLKVYDLNMLHFV